MLVLFPIPGYISKKVQDTQVQRIKLVLSRLLFLFLIPPDFLLKFKTDARVQDVTEAVNVIRMIKLFRREHSMSERIREKRNDELGWLWKLKVLETLSVMANNIIPAIVMLVTYATYTVIMKQELAELLEKARKQTELVARSGSFC
ncbi:hypothetical protein BYT27DRAFT_7215243 [Phlegmacium glaucopus]|nr:hypothetical protein BYT27DRAFT_7215243 [Phlegmacium glaucopus]